MKARILVIEDNPINLDLMTYTLSAFGHESLTATCGEQGLETARRERPDLILCDIQMPGMSGYEVVGLLKQDKELRDIPAVAVTAYAMVGDRDKALSAGFDDYVAKPIDPLSLDTTIRKLLATSKPAIHDGDGPAAAAKPPAPPAVPSRPVILVLDDIEMNLHLKRGLLEPSGYEVVTAKRVPEALAQARRIRPVMILSDVGLCHGHGFDFIREVKADENLRDIPFIFLTSTHTDERHRRQGLALGASRFIFRPVDPAEILAEIRACLEEAGHACPEDMHSTGPAGAQR